MIHIYIPYTERFFAVNFGLFLLTKKHPEWFKYETIIESAYGSFPHCIWNGGRTLHGDKVSEEIVASTVDLYNSVGIKFRLTFTNSFVTDEHLNDEYANMILDIASESGINEVLVNNDLIRNYIENKYPGKFEFIQSVTKCDRDVNSINEACQNYKLVVIDYRDGRDDDFLNHIKDKNKAEIMLNDICNFYCTQRLEHHKDVQRFILADSDMDKARELGFVGIDCPYKFIHYAGKANLDEFKEFIEDDKLGTLTRERFEQVYDLGFRHFKIVGRDFDAYVLALTYAYYLAKDEYKKDLLQELLSKKLEEVFVELKDYYLD